MTNFAINGFGRIGRSILRAFIEQKNAAHKCALINCGMGDLKSYVHLLKYDSTHGILTDVQLLSDTEFRVGTQSFKVIFEMDPAKINWASHGVDVVMECTGKFTAREKAAIHLQSGAKKVLVSAPGENADATIVLGVNDSSLKATDQVISIGSCTTNCLAPVAKALHDAFNIENGFMTTIHAYTSDQMLLDNFHKDLRRARSAATSMIPTSTGAAKAIGLVIPELAGKMDGVAIRVPVQNVSLVELVCNVSRETNAAEVNHILKAAAEKMHGILQYTEEELVSVDFNHNPHSSIVDANQTKVIGSKLVKVASWYDNEWGFSNRMIDALNLL